LNPRPEYMREEGREARRAPDRAATLAGAALVVLLWAVTQLWGLGAAPFHTKGEPREGIVVQSIVGRGEWVLPRRNGVELPRKPPLFHWLGALAGIALGRLDERSVRLPSALLSGASALALFVATRIVLTPRAALVAALALLTSFEWLRAATSARVDMTLAFGLTLAFTALLLLRAGNGRAPLVALYAGTAWATLAKGPVGIALPFLQVLVLSIVDRGLSFIGRLRPLRGAAFVLLVTIPWYLLALGQGGEKFFATQILDENVFRFLGDRRLTGGHRHGAGYLVLMLLAGFLPWTLLLPSTTLALWRDRRTLGRDDPRLFALLWTAVVFAFYALPASKRGVYLLPLYPALCFLLGWWADLSWRRPLPGKPIGVLAWLAAGVFSGLALACALATAGFSPFAAAADLLAGRAGDDVRSVALLVAKDGGRLALLFGLACLACLPVVLARKRSAGGVLIALLIITSAVTVAVRQIVLPHVAAERTPRAFAARLRERVREPDRLSFLDGFDYGVVFYLGGLVPVERAPLGASGPRYLVASEAGWQRQKGNAGALYEQVPGFTSEHRGNLGRLILLRRLTDAAPPR
jgi:4-amino-4-deoxy-L-arabinose transferase-like glycosyltransferase